jgi:molecular chaperone HtpG
VLVDAEYGLGSNLERILRSAKQALPETPRVLEVHIEHPIVKNLARLHEQGRDALAEPLGRLLLDHARLVEGEIQDPTRMIERLQKVMLQASAISLAPVLPVGEPAIIESGDGEAPKPEA